MLLPIVATLIVLLVLALGWRDIARFRARRVGAIAGVCITEAIRRRVLWITPLAIVGIIAVSQLSHPTDELDAIRQTIKYCLFASGLIVIIAIIILACTNLPKEIDSRVIYTIVTKPMSRLEIVLGKVLGFAGVSGLILLIMGIFTFAYLEVRAHAMQARIAAELKAQTVEPAKVVVYEHYRDAGLLSTKALAWPRDLQVFSRVPSVTGPRWIAGARNQYYTVPFTLGAAEQQEVVDLLQKGRAFFLITRPRLDRHAPTPEEEVDLRSGNVPLERAPKTMAIGPEMPTTHPTTAPDAGGPVPQVSITIVDAKQDKVAADEVTGKPLMAPPEVPGVTPPGPFTFAVPLSARALEDIAATGSGGGKDGVARVYVEVGATTPTFDYGADRDTTYIAVLQPILPYPPARAAQGAVPAGNAAGASSSQLVQAPEAGEYVLLDDKDNEFLGEPVSLAAGERLGFEAAGPTEVRAVAGNRSFLVPRANYLWMLTTKKIRPSVHEGASPAEQPPEPLFRSRLGRSGMMITGQQAPPTTTQPTTQPAANDAEHADGGSIAVFGFTHADVVVGAGDKLGLQLHLTAERSGELDAERNAVARASIQLRNRSTGALSPITIFEPENNRFTYVDVPADAARGGEFDVMLRGLTPGQWLGVQGPAASMPSVAVITAQRSFTGNLFKSLLILWMLSILVVIISVFCSTFLSWPIAVVLTVLLLLGHWGVDQLGDALAPGAGRAIGTDIFGVRDPARSRAVTAMSEAMSSMLRHVSKVLPDVSKFPVTEDVARGVSISPAKLGEAGGELALFGLPLIALTYLILRHKEVAP